ncbi:hypothetical protein [Edaphocola flava]|uniref:hypothetical protein n=1 Tax=Edaphocola flava TaxID=2499629 RepID=UPI00100A795D|nr:hypothetical protein [Edaphocola flava]
MENEIKFSMKVWNTLNMTKGCIATEVKPIKDENRKWIAIYPLDEGDNRGRYKYFEIELSRKIIDNDLDWFDQDEIKEEIFIHSLSELNTLLETKNLNPLSFDVPWKFNYPYHY